MPSDQPRMKISCLAAAHKTGRTRWQLAGRSSTKPLCWLLAIKSGTISPSPIGSKRFRSHPRIGQSRAAAQARRKSAAWSSEEQRNVGSAADEVRAALAEGNRAYEHKFGRIFIVCATGKSPTEILAILRRRLQNDETTELHEAAEEQRQIAHLRLKKWLNS